MSDFLRLLGYNPPLYWLIAGTAVLLWFCSAALPHQPAGGPLQRLNRPVFFGLTLLLAMFTCRWPTFSFRAVNPDEAQFLAGALTMLARHEFWWVDATTSGPLVVLPLTLPGVFGLPVDYRSGRVIALLLQWGTVLLTYLALRHLYRDRLARLLVLPFACFMVFLLFWDFVPFSSESVPLFLCALAVWLCLTAFQPDGRVASRGRLAVGGFVLGLLPFSKLQALPLGAAIGCSTLIWVLRQPQKSRREIGADLLRLLGGTAGGFGLMLLGLWRSGLMTDFFQSYLVHNLTYAQARYMPWADSVYSLRYLTEYCWGFASFHYGLLLLLGVSLWRMRGAPWRPLLLAWTLSLAAYYAMLAPGRLYPHYLFFLTLPLALLVGLGFGHLMQSAAPHRRLSVIFWSLFFVAGVGAQLADRAYDRHTLDKLAPRRAAWTNAVNFINQTKRPGDQLAIWGWRPDIFVETQLPQATREASIDRQLQDTPQRDYYRTRFLADLRNSRPAFFVDVVGPADFGHLDASLEGHETFPALKEYIGREYTLVSKADPVRVYVRRTLLGAPN